MPYIPKILYNLHVNRLYSLNLLNENDFSYHNRPKTYKLIVNVNFKYFSAFGYC